MRFDRTVTLGNLVSWLVMIIGCAGFYFNLQGDTRRNTEDITALKQHEVVAYKEINETAKDIAVMKSILVNLNEKINKIDERGSK